MKTLELKQMENIEAGKFWGSYTYCKSAGGLGGYYSCVADYYFWIRTSVHNCSSTPSDTCEAGIPSA